MSAKVYLVGAGPGSPMLITRRGWELLRRADVVIYDRLVSQALVASVPETCECIFMGKQGFSEHLDQAAINARIIEVARRDGIRTVVRLKGGDPFIFGRGGEEAGALAEAGIAFEVVPGVTSASAAGAYAGIPLTQRKITSSVKFITGNEDPSKPDSSIDWAEVAHEGGTLCLYMALHRLDEITSELMAAGRDGSTPVAVVERATFGRQRTCVATLADIARRVRECGIEAPAITIVGDVVARRDQLAWFETLPLQGRRIMVTRAKAQAYGLSEALSEDGAEVVICPVLEMRATEDHDACDESLRHLGDYTWLVLTSARAVDFLFERLYTLELDARALADLRIATIGKGTAAALRERGLLVDLVPEHYHSRALAEALLDAGLGPADAVFLPRAAAASDELPSILREASVRCDTVPLYETVIPADSEWREEGLSLLIRGDVDAVTFTSPSSVANLISLLEATMGGGGITPAEAVATVDMGLADGEGLSAARRVLSSADLFSIGPATTGALEAYGLTVRSQATEHTVGGLIATIVDYYGERS